MHILIVAATEAEIQGVISEYGFPVSGIKGGEARHAENKQAAEHPETEILITGVGMVATAFALGKQLAKQNYDLVINLGIAGSFDRAIELGEVVEIVQDTFAELGAEDDEQFLTLNEMGFGEVTFTPSRHPFLNIKQVTAITVNKVHGHEGSIQKVAERLNPQLESMEGAAVFYACKQAGVPCVQIRAVSNYVEKRNREAWKIGLAVKNLNTFAGEMLKVLGSEL
jgi:futalosine hydrolase